MNFVALIGGIAFGALFHSQVAMLWGAMREVFIHFIG